MKHFLFFLLFVLATSSCERREQAISPKPPIKSKASPVQLIIQNALSNPDSLQNISFADVVFASSGKEIIPVDPNLTADAELLAVISNALDNSLLTFNHPDSPTSLEKRINEVSRHFEKALQIEINSSDEFLCSPPLTAKGKTQHSGYPDLRIVHQETGQVTYLDPKLISEASINSSLRSFYYTPKKETGKIQDDAHHLLVGITHDGNHGAWKFTGWHLIDLFALKIRLKPEFQANNKDLYRNDLSLMKRQNTPAK